MGTFPNIPGYQIERELGRGGMAAVYLAREDKLDRPVALKVLELLSVQSEDLAKRFMREARTAARLQHSNIISIFDVGQVENLSYISMEYLSGGTLREIIRADFLRPEDALSVLHQLAKALSFAHSQEYIHRDIKPENIMFRRDGSVVLTDFGIARSIGSATRLTRTGLSIGTPHYMSPEQARGLEVDGRADLYSLGIVLYEMLLGRVPYEAEDSVAIAIKHIQDPIPELPLHLRRYQTLLLSMLAKDREERVKSGEELIIQINKLIDVGADVRQQIKHKGQKKAGVPHEGPSKELMDSKLDEDGSQPEESPEPSASMDPKGNYSKSISLFEGYDVMPLRRTRLWLISALSVALVVTVMVALNYLTKQGSYKNMREGSITSLLQEVPESPSEKHANLTTAQTHEVPAKTSWEELREKQFNEYLLRARASLDSGDLDQARFSLSLAETIKKESPDVKSLKSIAAGIEERRLREENLAASLKSERESRMLEEDIDAYQRAVSSNTSGALREYVRDYPQGKHTAEALQRIQQIEEEAEKHRQEENAWIDSEKKGTSEAYRKYLNIYPSGKHSVDAKNKISNIEREASSSSNIEATSRVEEPSVVAPRNNINRGDLIDLKSVDIEPQLIKKVDPSYPYSARVHRMRGKVMLLILISEIGEVTDVRIIQGMKAYPAFDKAAEDAVRQWNYTPARKNGVPVRVWKPISIYFTFR